MSRFVPRLDLLVFLAGVLLFVALLLRFDPATVLANVAIVGWGILPLVGREAVACVTNTAAWRLVFPSPRPTLPFRHLVMARMSGDAVNYLTPTATIAGEFVRMRILGPVVERNDLLVSLIAAKLTQSLGQMVFLSAGWLLVARDLPLPPGVRMTVTSVLVFVVSVMTGIFLLQRYGGFAPLVRAAGRSQVGWVQRLSAAAAQLDADLSRLQRESLASLTLSILLYALTWASLVIETGLVLHFLGVSVPWWKILALEVMSGTFDALLFFVPAKAGTQEGGKVVVFSWLGFDPALGLTVGLMRRLRELLWAGLGLSFYAWFRRSPLPQVAR